MFLQCRPLADVSWESFGTWDRIDVLIVRPVQIEIDAFKGKGNSRQAAKARKTSSVIRELIKAPDCCKEVRKSPAVRVCFRNSLRRDEAAAGVLDYNERDDQLVGIALAFQKENPAEAVWLLSDDTGPMASAQLVGLHCHEVPDSWRLPPETDESDKRVNELQAELARYRKAEPAFEIAPIGTEGRVRADVTMYRGFAESEMRSLLERLRSAYPEKTDFTPEGPTQRELPARGLSAKILQQLTVKEVLEPPTDEQIDSYKREYVAWMKKCEIILGDLADFLNAAIEWPEVAVRIQNTGSRPALNALVVVSTQGGLQLFAPEGDGDNDGESASVKGRNLEPDAGDGDDTVLPAPPVPPTATWKRVESAAVRFPTQVFPTIPSTSGRPFDHSLLLGTRELEVPEVPDPNTLYFKEGGSGKPTTRIELECAQWRHAHEPEEIRVSVMCPLKPGVVSGLVQVKVHAANLTMPAEMRLPVDINVTQVPCGRFAEKLLEQLKA